MAFDMNRPEKDLIQDFKKKLSTDRAWVEKAIVTLYKLQTEDEKTSEETSIKNGVGFSGVDAGRFSRYAKIIDDGWHLNPNDLQYAFRRMPHYARQLVDIAKSKQQE